MNADSERVLAFWFGPPGSAACKAAAGAAGSKVGSNCSQGATTSTW